jgi:phosphatidylglycerol:prolipoprotein diacylglycerol transferase
VIVVSTALAGVIAGRLPAPHLSTTRPAGRSARALRRARAAAATVPGLDREVLLYLLLGAVPGALVGGRIGYVLTHLDYYAEHPSEVLDLGSGSLELTLAVLGGTLSAAVVARMFRAPVRRWLHAAAVPLLVGIGLGKLAMVLDASGQGIESSLPWATAYAGPGPWASLGPAIPSHPAQVYEALAALGAGALLAIAVVGAGRFRRQDGALFLAALTFWTLSRAVVAITWRDALVVGSLGAAQLLSLGVGLAAGGLWASGRWLGRGASGERLASAPARPGPAGEAPQPPAVEPASPARRSPRRRSAG